MAKYSKEVTKKIVKSIEDAIPNKYAAQLAGISETTFYEWMEKHKEFAESIKGAEGKRIQRLVREIAEARTKDGDPLWTARAWLLERLDKETFHLPTRAEQILSERLDEIEVKLDEYLDAKTKEKTNGDFATA